MITSLLQILTCCGTCGDLGAIGLQGGFGGWLYSETEYPLWRHCVLGTGTFAQASCGRWCKRAQDVVLGEHQAKKGGEGDDPCPFLTDK